jgi:hypothetical protein
VDSARGNPTGGRACVRACVLGPRPGQDGGEMRELQSRELCIPAARALHARAHLSAGALERENENIFIGWERETVGRGLRWKESVWEGSDGGTAD